MKVGCFFLGGKLGGKSFFYLAYTWPESKKGEKMAQKT